MEDREAPAIVFRGFSTRLESFFAKCAHRARILQRKTLRNLRDHRLQLFEAGFRHGERVLFPIFAIEQLQ